MALTKKLSLLCMSILTLNFISNNNSYAGNSGFIYKPIEYNFHFNNKIGCENILELYKNID